MPTFIYIFFYIYTTMSEYKKCECLACGNIFPSKAKKIKCRNGQKKGCNSTKCVVLEVKSNILDQKPQEEQVEEVQEEEHDDDNGWF